MICNHCTSMNRDGMLFCRACGMSMGGTEIVECESHPAANATGICIVCRRPVCCDCSSTKGGKVFCMDASHSRLTETHTRFASAHSEFDADLIVRNLSANDVPALAFSSKQYGEFHRFTDLPEVSLFVPSEMHESALRIVEELDLSDFLLKEGNHP